MGQGRNLPSTEDQAVSTRQDYGSRPYLASLLRRNAARSKSPSHAERDAGAAGHAPVASKWMVARYGATAPRLEAGQVGRSCASESGAHFEEPPRPLSRRMDARGLECSDRAA